MKKIIVISSSRSDLGILERLIKDLSKKSRLKITLIFTGTHLIKEFGKTITGAKKIFDKKKLKINLEIINLTFISDKNVDLIKIKNKISMGLVKILLKIKPNLSILLGDRFEILECALTLYISRIPIAHLHGGEVSGGSYDDSMRHAISKLSNYHFVSHIDYKKRLLKLGENKNNIFCYGSLGVERTENETLIPTKKLEKILNIKFQKRKTILVYHPTSECEKKSILELNTIIQSLSYFKNMTIIATYPGLENGSLKIRKLMNFYKGKITNFHVYDSLGSKLFLSLMNNVDFIIGNSSSGIIEMASFKKAALNLGNRQSDRLQSKNTINCRIKKNEIIKSINQIYSKNFQKKLKNVKNIYSKKNALINTVQKINELSNSKIMIKKFIDN